MLNISPNSSFVRDTSGITTDRLKTLLNQTSQRQLINRDKQLTQKRILFSVIFLCLVQVIVPDSFLHLNEKTVNAKRLIIVTCILYTIRVFIHYIHISLARYVFLTKNELKQIGLFTPESGFIVCDAPQVAEASFNRHKYLNRFLCWISPQFLYTSILGQQKPINTTLPLRVLTATLADRIASLINIRPIISPTKFDKQKDLYDRTSSNIATPDPLATLRNSVYWQSSPESPSTNLSDCSRYLNGFDREALDLSNTSHSRSLNESFGRSPIISTNAMNDTVAELRSRPYQMANVRSATSQHGSTVVDDDARKSDYKRIISNSNTGSGSNQTGGTQNTVKWRKVRIDGPQLFVLRENMRKWLTKTILIPLTREIENINQSLIALGHTDIIIGKTTTNEIKSFIRSCTNTTLVSQLNEILPNFEIHSNQEYILSRIQILARTYMSDYNWKSGVITDAELVFNLFCIYFDRRLTPDPRFLDGKVFRGNYVIRQAQLTNIARYPIAIFVYQEKPPIYKVLSNGEIHDVPAGDHNLLDCLLLFVECVNSTRNRHLGSLNLGASGVDILWTITSPSLS
ncbi:unnamed protein product [Rotaria sordida]|uniref:Uncharacterized protein n=1 Tax=Rotaria sordida TaxID=392033 RepID=A0A818UFX9_9BILA|nr:unnamed protein product [Rotaria sordida]CAF1176114.1 unnamed protein product [Rotaria sordida]CAF1433266.1 unnamed protein product [Rotaria sordida]CAF3696574.1 unnamed protein product [Rotaria sordida]